jgi:sulfofructose kinase
LKKIDVFGLGQCSLDHLAGIRGYPPPDTKCEFSAMEIQGGGPVATALVALSRWGLSCAFSGVVGDDEWGEKIRASLQAEGIETGGLLTRPDSASQFAFIAAEAGTGRRTIFWRRPTGPPPSPAEVPWPLLMNAAIFHTDGLFIDAALAAAKAARNSGVTVSVDAGTIREGMLNLARWSDCFIASETFSRTLVGGDDPEGACRKLAELGPRIVGVTLGARGYAGLAGGKFVRRPAHPADALDTTGCGDVFHAGFLFGLHQKWDVEKCFEFAAWAAGRVSTRLGGRSGIPTAEAMEKQGFL